MQRFLIVLSALSAFACPAMTLAQAREPQQNFPMWENALRFLGGDSDATTVPTTMMGNHMQMSVKQPMQPGDEARARSITLAAHAVLVHYSDVKVAEADGYKPFLPTGKMGEEVHYSNGLYSLRENTAVDYDHPGSILYKRTPQGMVAVGVMYGGPANATAAQLNERAPISIAPWHRHVDFCGAPNGTPLANQFGPHAKFGFDGSIHTEAGCNEAGGLWIPLAFGWMTHVYPNETDPAKIWGGAHMQEEMHSDDAGAAAMTM